MCGVTRKASCRRLERKGRRNSKTDEEGNFNYGHIIYRHHVLGSNLDWYLLALYLFKYILKIDKFDFFLN